MDVDWQRVIEIVLSGLISYLTGHRVGRAKYRKGGNP